MFNDKCRFPLSDEPGGGELKNENVYVSCSTIDSSTFHDSDKASHFVPFVLTTAPVVVHVCEKLIIESDAFRLNSILRPSVDDKPDNEISMSQQPNNNCDDQLAMTPLDLRVTRQRSSPNCGHGDRLTLRWQQDTFRMPNEKSLSGPNIYSMARDTFPDDSCNIITKTAMVDNQQRTFCYPSTSSRRRHSMLRRVRSEELPDDETHYYSRVIDSKRHHQQQNEPLDLRSVECDHPSTAAASVDDDVDGRCRRLHNTPMLVRSRSETLLLSTDDRTRRKAIIPEATLRRVTSESVLCQHDARPHGHGNSRTHIFDDLDQVSSQLLSFLRGTAISVYFPGYQSVDLKQISFRKFWIATSHGTFDSATEKVLKVSLSSKSQSKSLIVLGSRIRPSHCRFVRSGTGASLGTLLSLRRVIQERQLRKQMASEFEQQQQDHHLLFPCLPSTTAAAASDRRHESTTIITSSSTDQQPPAKRPKR